MKLQGRDLKSDLRGADVRLLHFELRLLRLDIPEEETLENHFGEGTQQAVRHFQEQLDLEADGIVGSVTARRINAEVRQRVPAGEALEQLAQSVKRTLEQIDALQPGGDNLRAHIKRFSETLKAFAAALDTLRQLDAPGDRAADVEEMLEARRAQLTELTGSLADDQKEAEAFSHVVSGGVQREDGLPLQGVRVRVSHEAENGVIRLGEGMTDAEGHYTIRYESLPGKRGINLRVSAIGEDGKPLQSSDVIQHARPLERIDLVTPLAEKPPAEQRIEGAIVLEHGAPADNLTLRLYRRDFGGKTTLLDETSTLEGGQYAFTYDSGSGAPSLEVRAVNDAGEEVPLSKSLNEISRKPRATLNLAAPAMLKPQAAEYRRLAGDLTPHLGQMAKLAEAKENEAQQDLTVLNRATGWDARLIALAAMSERLGADPEMDLPREAVYGLLRAGLPSDKLLLAQVAPDAAEQALRTTRDAGIVELTDQDIGAFKQAFTTFSNKVRLSLPAPGSRSTYGALLRSSGLPQDAQDTFAPIYLNHRGDADRLWEKAREAGLGDAQIGRLQLQGKFAFLAGNSEAMTDRLLKKQVGDPAKLVEQDLHRADVWTAEVLAQAGIPADRRDNLTDADRETLDALIPAAYAAEDVEDRLSAYAEDMARKVRLSYPTQVVGRLMETDDHFKPLAAKGGTVTLLKNAAAQGFRLGETPVTTFLRDHDEVMAGIDDGEVQVARQQLGTLQRVYQITPGNEAMPVLMQLDMTSAYDVMAYPEAEFVELYDKGYLDLYDKTPPKQEARLIRRKAKQVSSVTYNLFTIAKKMESEPPMAGVSAQVEVRENVRNELIKHFPTMESLFGSMDFCECEHCRSVLSPAAYLVDLLQFVDPEPGVWGNFLAHWKATHGDEDYPHEDAGGKAMRPYDVLIERRPDLPHIPLTCENTHTTLPYIDVVNEILEYYVAHGKLEEAAARDTGEATTDELLAEPQHVIRAAYDKLREARYPLNLPFDLWIETARQFCQYFETPLDQVLETFRASDALFASAQPFDRAAVFVESLGLSPAEAALFTNPDPLSTWHELYGFSSAAEATTETADPDTGQRIDLNSAKALSRRLDVTYKEITKIVQTGFVNPKLTQLRLLYTLGVSIRDARFYLDHKWLLGQDPDTLSSEDQKRRLEVEAFAKALENLAEAFETDTAQLENELQAIPFDDILVLADPDAGCNFDLTTLQYADGTKAKPIDFLRINLFVRLWRKLGWSIEETDRALSTFIPQTAPYDENPAHLAKQPLKTALIYLAHLNALDKKVRVGKQSLLKLLTLWSDLATTGEKPLYAQLFLTRSVLQSAPVFDHPLGQYLTDPAVELKDHVLAVQGALGLTASEIARILEDNGQSLDSAKLSLPTVSLLYRYGLLAEALKLPVRELIALKQLSGLDPFKPLHPDPLATIEEDHPFSQTLRFVDISEEVKKSGLTIEDLDYLLRHRYDETGTYRPDREATLALLKTLAEGVRAIRAEHAVPDDPGALSEEVLRQKLGLALPPDVVERFLAMMNGTAEFTATRSGVAAADQLAPEGFADEPAIRDVRYDVARQEQKLTFRGVLFDEQKNQLKNNFDPSLSPTQQSVFTDLLDDVQQQAQSFFEKHLQKQAPGVQPAYGFLEAADFDLLFDRDLALAPGETEQDRLRTQQSRLAETFLPHLQQRLIRQFIVQTMTAHTGADPALVERLVTDERLLAGAGSNPLLASFAATGQRGVSAAFFDSDDLSGAAQAATPVVRSADTVLKDTQDAADNSLNPANSARFEGYLEAPTPGAYRFFIELDKQDAEAELRFDHLPDPVFLTGTAAADDTTLGDQPDAFVELEPGVPYRFSLELKKLGGGGARLLVQGETLPKDGVSQLTLYPLSAMAGAERAILLLTKTLQLAQSLGLSEREIRYLLTHAADFGGVNLSQWPTQPVGDTPAEKAETTERFTQFLRLAAYAQLKRALAGGTDDLIGIFEANGTGDLSSVYTLIAKLTRRDEATVNATAEALSVAPGFESEKPLWRLWEALQIVERFGVPVASLLAWTRIVRSDATPEQRFGIARDLKEAIKARFEPETWQRVAQPIFDTLRQRQRDALVSHVLHQHGFDRLEQLYEYFLIDPGMEPVVQTSRIRLAIASLQLFIQRCLLNLEVMVQPSTINARHWAWMKRYRVWEANRKIFLFPENWLEPEFRDDKTHLFNELEGALLQGDVSSDLVEDAFLSYLRKLEELARLDIVAMHIEDDPDPTRRTLHVVGRTYSQPHKYFYRRYAHQMWTPWEPVSAEVEGDHLAPVVWRDRLYLFWVTFMDKPAETPQPTGSAANTKVTDLKLRDAVRGMQSMVKNKVVEVQLHWSEYLQGEWSTRESSGFSAVIAKTVSASFKPSSVFIHVAKAYDAGEERGVYVTLGGAIKGSKIGSFYLAGRNSLPEKKGYRNKPVNPYNANDVQPTRYGGDDSLTVTFKQRITTEAGKQAKVVNNPLSILQEGTAYTLLPCNNDITLGGPTPASLDADRADAVARAIAAGLPEIASLIKPIFYQNSTDTLFVEPDVMERTVEEWKGWIPHPPQSEPGWHIPDRWKDITVIPEIPWNPRFPDPEEGWQVPIDPGSLINPRPGDDWLVNPLTGLRFEDEVIGPGGRAGIIVLPSHEVAEIVLDDASLANIHIGSDLPMEAVAIVPNAVLGQAGITKVAGGLNVVGGAGFSSELAQNLNELNRSRVESSRFDARRPGH